MIDAFSKNNGFQVICSTFGTYSHVPARCNQNIPAFQQGNYIRFFFLWNCTCQACYTWKATPFFRDYILFFFFFWRKGSQVTSYRKLPRALQTLDSLQLTSCVAGKLKSYTTVKILWRYYNFLTRFLLVEICSGRSVTDIKLRNSKPYNFHSRFL